MGNHAFLGQPNLGGLATAPGVHGFVQPKIQRQLRRRLSISVTGTKPNSGRPISFAALPPAGICAAASRGRRTSRP
jgi:hypothetical protein